MLKFKLLLLVLFTFSCSQKSPMDSSSSDVKVKIPWYNTDSGSYALMDVTLSGLFSLRTMSGNYAKFYFEPSLTKKGLAGPSPQLQFFKNSQGVYIAKDFVSLQAASVYAAMEQMAHLDQQVGAEAVNRWPREIGMAVRVMDSGSLVRNNALYDGDSDAILIMNYTFPDMPMYFNLGILAHEHFHSLFYKLVLKRVRDQMETMGLARPSSALSSAVTSLTPHDDLKKTLRQSMGFEKNIVEERDDKEHKTPEAMYMSTYLRGINEGMADFWAWVFTNDPDFIARSLPSEKENRSLTTTRQGLLTEVRSEEKLRQEVQNIHSRSFDSSSDSTRLAYSLGTEHARLLKLLTQLLVDTRGVSLREAKLLTSRALIKILTELPTVIFSKNKEFKFGPYDLVKKLGEALELQNSSSSECQFLADLLNVTKSGSQKTLNCELNSKEGKYKLKEINL